MSLDTAAVRPGEELDRVALTRYLEDKIVGGGNLSIEQFPGGHSNLTYLLPRPRASTCCAAARSARWRLKRTTWRASTKCSRPCILFSAAPEVFLLCEDPSDHRRACSSSWSGGAASWCAIAIPPELAAFPDYPDARQPRLHRLPGRAARGRHRKARPDLARQAGRISRTAGARLVRPLESRQDRRDRH